MKGVTTMTNTIEQTRITLRNLKVAEFASEETLCFKAVVLFDGEPIGDAENDGHGGCTFVRPRKDAHAKLAEAEAFAKTLAPLVTAHDDPNDRSRKLTLEVTLDLLIDELAEEMHHDRKIRASFKRDITRKLLYLEGDRLFYLKNTDLRSIQDKDAFYALFRGKHGADTVILNTLPDEEAFALWKQHVVPT
jgi:hypothetical protein